MAEKLTCHKCGRKWLASYPENFKAHVDSCVAIGTARSARDEARRKREQKKKKGSSQDLMNTGRVYGYPRGYWSSGDCAPSAGQDQPAIIRPDKLSPTPAPTPKKMAKCPKCKASVRRDRLARHLKRVHGVSGKSTRRRKPVRRRS